MNRRDALAATGLLMGSTLLSSGWLEGCAPAPKTSEEASFTPEDIALLDQIGDAFLPETPTSPGAKSARTGAFVAMMLTDCYEPEEKAAVINGLADFRNQCQKTYGRAFANLSPAEKEAFLLKINEAAGDNEEHYFATVKSLTEHGFFTSEAGMTQALRWIPVPGRWEGCIPLAPGQPAWA